MFNRIATANRVITHKSCCCQLIQKKPCTKLQLSRKINSNLRETYMRNSLYLCNGLSYRGFPYIFEIRSNFFVQDFLFNFNISNFNPGFWGPKNYLGSPRIRVFEDPGDPCWYEKQFISLLCLSYRGLPYILV